MSPGYKNKSVGPEFLHLFTFYYSLFFILPYVSEPVLVSDSDFLQLIKNVLISSLELLPFHSLFLKSLSYVYSILRFFLYCIFYHFYLCIFLFKLLKNLLDMPNFIKIQFAIIYKPSFTIFHCF